MTKYSNSHLYTVVHSILQKQRRKQNACVYFTNVCRSPYLVCSSPCSANNLVAPALRYPRQSLSGCEELRDPRVRSRPRALGATADFANKIRINKRDILNLYQSRCERVVWPNLHSRGVRDEQWPWRGLGKNLRNSPGSDNIFPY